MRDGAIWVLVCGALALGCSSELPGAPTDRPGAPDLEDVPTVPLEDAMATAAPDATVVDGGDMGSPGDGESDGDMAATDADATDTAVDASEDGGDTVEDMDTGPALVVLPCQTDLGVVPTVEARCPDSAELANCFTFDADVDQGDGTWQVLDESGNAGHGTSSGGFGHDPSGLHDTAGVFDGTAQVTVPWHAGLDAQNTATVEAWVDVDAIPGSGRLGVIDGPNAGETMFIYAGGVLRCYVNGTELRSDPGVVPVGRWAHLACVVDESGQRGYVDGSLVAEGPAPAPFQVTENDETYELGANRPTNDFLVGRMDTARVWTEARTAADICLAASQRPAE